MFRSKKSIIILIVVVVLLTGGGFLLFGEEEEIEIPQTVEAVFIEPRPDIELEDPYEEVDWNAYGQHYANLHTHTRNSDGVYSVPGAIDAYYERGYEILAIADHNYVTWPWEDYDRDPEELGMLAVQANEISDTHHIGSYFNDFDIDGREYSVIWGGTGEKADISEDEVLHKIAERDGLAVFFHPGRYEKPAGYYEKFYKKYDHLVGMEVVNQRDRYPQDRAKWDDVLTMLMPERPVWGFANDDMHAPWHVGNSYNIFLLPELTEEKFRTAMKTGQFYFSNGEGSPTLDAVNVDNDEGTVSVDVDDVKEIVWISDGMVIGKGDTLEFTNTANVGSYVRAEIIGEEGITYTNPFGVIEG